MKKLSTYPKINKPKEYNKPIMQIFVDISKTKSTSQKSGPTLKFLAARKLHNYI